MPSDHYLEISRSFRWADVRASLDWAEDAKVSLGNAIVDRHAPSGRTALVSQARDGTVHRLSYLELSKASNRFANLLRGLGVVPGDRVAGLMPRGSEVLIAMVGALKVGAIYVPAFTGFSREAVGYRLINSDAKILVTHQDCLGQIPQESDAVRIVVSVPDAEPLQGTIDFHLAIAQQPEEFDEVLRDRSDPAALIYTSGSTGQPKGGTLAVNFLAAIRPYIQYGLDLRHDDVFWPTGDPGWGYGFICYLGAFAAGATVVTVQQNPTAELCLSVIENHEVTNLATTPTLLRSLMAESDDALRKSASRLRAVSSCGEPLNAKVVESFQRVLNVTPMDHFGATEYALPIGNYNAIDMVVKPGSMGLPSPGYKMAVIDESGKELLTDEIGFIAKKTGDDCRYWLKYWNDPVATNTLVRDGWIVTGDLGRRDTDGYFWFEGRADDMIKSSGYRIGPFEVESALLKHPAVAEAAVVGKPDEMRGQIVKAFIVLRDGFSVSESLSEELVKTVKDSVGKYQFPRLIEYVTGLPKTETGKILRAALRQRA